MQRMVNALLSSFAMIALIIGLGLHSPTYAQAGATSASITGTVADEEGGVIGGATVTIKNSATKLTRDGASSENGTYLIKQLPPGNYELTITAEGFKSQTVNVALELGTTPRVDF